MINPSFQQYSPDGFFRLSAFVLYRTKFSHLYSEPFSFGREASGSPSFRGITEWSCALGCNLLSLSWDWRRVDDGAILFDVASSIRTNVMLTCEKGYDLGVEQTEALLTDFIATIPWQIDVAKALRSVKVVERLSHETDFASPGLSLH